MINENDKPLEVTPTPSPTPAPTLSAVPPVPIIEWIITFFLLAIPILNLILLIIWGFSRDTNPSKANFAKAYLLIMLVFFSLSILFIMLFGAGIWAFLQNQSESLIPSY